ncbi:ImmA/IrrE family metallo-endopeptidase [Bacillus pumilus]|uniref:ImmA/IrrE family metallo-endopeptidase n=1 Tax=Bacillus pumilus TaxID=1408 RepID=UPI0028CB1A2A|nr:ImmA/IrrE family metallo-endopeptidase [Bacillus pumilus]
MKHKVDAVLSQFGTNNVYEICQQLNICILPQPLGSVNGFLQFYQEENIFLIHINEEIKRQEFTIAHELGHYFLHKALNTFKIANCSTSLEDKLEQQADIFASELLLTDDMITNALPKIQNCKQEQAASFFQLPITVIHYKYSQMQLLSKKRTESRSNNYFSLAF